LAPSIFLRTRLDGSSDDAPEALFRCPACDGLALEQELGALRCPACASVWPIVDGLYDFRWPRQLSWDEEG
jgi:hypothetical protein